MIEKPAACLKAFAPTFSADVLIAQALPVILLKPWFKF